MPKKPTGIRTSHGEVVRDEKAVQDAGLHLANPERAMFALEALFEDTAAKHPAAGRYSRVKARVMAHFTCSHASAERAIRDARAYNADRFLAELPYMRAESSEQLQRIADTQEDASPMAAIAALREKHSINGLHVNTVNVGATSPEQQAMISALVLTPHQREQKIAKLRAENRPSAKSPDDENG